MAFSIARVRSCTRCSSWALASVSASSAASRSAEASRSGCAKPRPNAKPLRGRVEIGDDAVELVADRRLAGRLRLAGGERAAAFAECADAPLQPLGQQARQHQREQHAEQDGAERGQTQQAQAALDAVGVQAHADHVLHGPRSHDRRQCRQLGALARRGADVADRCVFDAAAQQADFLAAQEIGAGMAVADAGHQHAQRLAARLHDVGAGEIGIEIHGVAQTREETLAGRRVGAVAVGADVVGVQGGLQQTNVVDQALGDGGQHLIGYGPVHVGAERTGAQQDHRQVAQQQLPLDREHAFPPLYAPLRRDPPSRSIGNFGSAGIHAAVAAPCARGCSRTTAPRASGRVSQTGGASRERRRTSPGPQAGERRPGRRPADSPRSAARRGRAAAMPRMSCGIAGCASSQGRAQHASGRGRRKNAGKCKPQRGDFARIVRSAGRLASPFGLELRSPDLCRAVMPARVQGTSKNVEVPAAR
ncbi:MAG TPA: hypothetical protein VM847_22250 [Tahibacter sp.]|nr:hypothetical protein [Tahibacter sp.]